MKFLDRFLRDWRVRVASPFVRPNDAVLDIGCFDGYLFKALKNKPISRSIGLDPLLEDVVTKDGYTLIPQHFPNGLGGQKGFDCITMLAVLEHIPRSQQKMFNDEFAKVLSPKGRIIITVPSPFVDHILTVLTRLRLIDGMSVEEHFGFETKEVYSLFNKDQFKLLKHKKFQLGLNNLFVFEKK